MLDLEQHIIEHKQLDLTGVLGFTIVSAHNQLSGLLDDDHTQYALLAGRGGTNAFTGTLSTTGDILDNADLQIGTEKATDVYLYYGKSGNANTLHVARAGVGDALSFDVNRNATFASNVGIGGAPVTQLTLQNAGEAGARFLGNGLTTTSHGLFVGYNSGAYVYNHEATTLTLYSAGDISINSSTSHVNIPSLTASQLVATDSSKNLVSLAGLSTTVSYTKPGGATGTLTFTSGILTEST